jgi:hypothetical protein
MISSGRDSRINWVITVNEIFLNRIEWTEQWTKEKRMTLVLSKSNIEGAGLQIEDVALIFEYLKNN